MDERSDRSSVHAQAGREFEQLADAVAADPGCDAFPLLADSRRRAGHVSEAREIAEAGLQRRPASAEGRIALALALMDQGELAPARRVLSDALLGAEAPGAESEPWPPRPAVASADNVGKRETVLDERFVVLHGYFDNHVVDSFLCVHDGRVNCATSTVE